LPKAIQEVTEMLVTATREEVELLRGHRQYLREWSEQATSCLGIASLADEYRVIEDADIIA
jgi:hypothetical protein